MRLYCGFLKYGKHILLQSFWLYLDMYMEVTYFLNLILELLDMFLFLKCLFGLVHIVLASSVAAIALRTLLILLYETSLPCCLFEPFSSWIDIVALKNTVTFTFETIIKIPLGVNFLAKMSRLSSDLGISYLFSQYIN